ncbi:hypothetical protein IW261DRAFT_1525235 [Armillaria novae-zelandiae]|uniref:Heterokaryon incompatibility domain-containing protein n=1 Tax=Armillaria novae-zelandiae TaxID=153914 RepID=A0AA39ND20_9AGAR|nr:hypothetical protein IW261DRAFT_1525235 [Armillaria novae-zelandiae]
MLNLGVEYTWLDVLCLRQKGGTCDSERLRVEEWKLDVPTIGAVYGGDRVVIYMSGLGRPLTLKEGDLQSDRCWFRRAWTVQEVGRRRIIAGDMPDGPLHAEPIDKDDTGMLAKFHLQLQVIDSIHYLSQPLFLSAGMFGVLSEMQNRVSTNPVDKVAGVAAPLVSYMIPAYHETESLEDAWTALVNVMLLGNRGELFFWYPEPGDAGKKWRPSWEQVMNKCLPVNRISAMVVGRDDETEEDWYEGLCVEKGFVRGLAVGSMGQDNRCGELIVKHTNGTEHTFSIIARHGYPILEDTYTLLGMDPAATEDKFAWIRWMRIDQAAVRSEIRIQYWVIGRKLPDEKFEKVSVFEMANEDEVGRLSLLDITEQRRTILV